MGYGKIIQQDLYFDQEKQKIWKKKLYLPLVNP